MRLFSLSLICSISVFCCDDIVKRKIMSKAARGRLVCGCAALNVFFPEVLFQNAFHLLVAKLAIL